MRLAVGLDLYEEGYKIDVLGFKIPVPVKNPREPRDIMETWGIKYSDKALFLRWGTRCKIIWAPWDWGCCVRDEVMNTKGQLEKSAHWKWANGKTVKTEDDRETYQDEYTYVLKSGEVQKRIATYHIEEREWRWRLFQWLYKKGIKLGPKLVQRTIAVNFSDEVGERTGSWKGGTIGCGYNILPGETPQDCLRRMERERIFN
jgi:hypothetical protein